MNKKFSRRNFMKNSALMSMGAAVSMAMATNAVAAPQPAPDEGKIYPRAVTHVGINVANIEEGIEWYTRVFGWTVLMAPSESVANEGYMGTLAADLYTKEFKKNKMAMLSTGNGCAVEFFEFIEPSTARNARKPEPWVSGFWHICILDPDIEGMVKRITENGGKQVSKIWHIAPGTALPYKICYTQDPWGNYIEISSRSADQIMAPR